MEDPLGVDFTAILDHDSSWEDLCDLLTVAIEILVLEALVPSARFASGEYQKEAL